MGKFILFIIILVIIGVICLTLVGLIGKLAYLHKKTKYAESLLEEYISKKIKLLTKLNASIKKTLRAKKDYLLNISDLEKDGLTNQEKDIKLSEYNITVENLMSDYSKLANHKEIKKQVEQLVDLDEKMDATKTYFNKYMTKLSQSTIKFPINILAKFMKIKIIPLYDTNDTIKKLSEEL